MTTSLLILLLAALSFYRHGENRYSILVFAALCGFFKLASSELTESDGFIYHFGAVIADLLIVIALSRPIKLTSTIINLQKIAVWFIYVNALGWVIYENYYPPFIYDSLCLTLFIAALVVAVKKGGSRGLGYNSNELVFYSGYNRCIPQTQRNQKKV